MAPVAAAVTRRRLHERLIAYHRASRSGGDPEPECGYQGGVEKLLPGPTPRSRKRRAEVVTGAGDERHPADSAEAPQEIHVFHQRDLAKATQPLEYRSPHKDPLVAVAKEPKGQTRAERVKAQQRLVAVEA